ncbi:flagellar export protein FliJ [Cellulomonas sp. JZ18]|uniref:flagellar export protein FliJ n=1 Tax=Cellulomonas sp. JZ18 TaxID=2654191 RepID=UPI0012D4182A|nr:flagellar FliJ family protein [Cellulomonas sp. JZ18]QGQ20303.1 flagellar export protein FliJ [Cellulomonas sp. JZ18]
MSRQFPLAGLLRVRGMAEDRAAGELASARREQLAAQERARETAEMLGTTGLPGVHDVVTWQATVAGRLALQSLLVERSDAARRAAEVVDARQDAWSRARTATRTVEKLRDAHEDQVRVEEDRAEQRVLDEVAGRVRGAGGPEHEEEGR